MKDARPIVEVMTELAHDATINDRHSEGRKFDLLNALTEVVRRDQATLDNKLWFEAKTALGWSAVRLLDAIAAKIRTDK